MGTLVIGPRLVSDPTNRSLLERAAVTRNPPSIGQRAGTWLAAALLCLSMLLAPPIGAQQQQQQQQQQPTQTPPPQQAPAETPTITARVEPQQISANVPKTEVLCSGLRRDQRPVLRCSLRFDNQIDVVNSRVVERGANPPVEWTASFRPTPVTDDDSAFFFLIDRTDTRRAATLRTLTRDLTEMLGRKGARQQVAVATYSASLDVLANFTRESREATQALTRVRADGVASEVFRLSIDAIKRLEAVQASSKFLVIMSDGRADDTVIKIEDVADAARKANVRIVAIGYAESEAGRPDLQRLRVLAQQTNGLFIEVPIRTKQIPQDVRQNLFQRFIAGGVLEAEAPGNNLPGAVEVTITYPQDRTLSFAAVLTDTQPNQQPVEQKPMVMDPDQAFEFSVDGIINWLFDPPWRALAAATVLSILVGGLILALARRSARRKAARKAVTQQPPRPIEPIQPPAVSVPPPLSPNPAAAAAVPTAPPSPAFAPAALDKTVVNPPPPPALEPPGPVHHAAQEATEVRFSPTHDAVHIDTPVTLPEPAEIPPDSSADETRISSTSAPEEAMPAMQDGGGAAAKPVSQEPPRPTIAVLQFADNLGTYPMRLHKISIGRHTDNDIRIEDVTVSRHHAIVSLAPNGGFEIHNLTASRSERNPVLVNGIEQDRAVLTDGDEVTIGSVKFRFLVGQSPEL